jgi:predicted TIM-barrel fold metal-dependent hydrolase
MIAVFGPDRCMFESNFPVDKISVSYVTFWNAMKKIAADYDAAAQDAMFAGTARRVYGI